MVNEFKIQNSKFKIGVLAVQGSFIEHIEVLKDMGICVASVKSVEDIRSIDGLIIPGGESTTISKLMRQYDIDKEIILRSKNGMPIYGTCAGMILLSKNIDYSMRLMDMDVDRNAYGRQLDSFICELKDIDIQNLKTKKLDACFIRAPRITRVGDSVEILARYENEPVLVKEKNMMVSSFHPELTGDRNIYKFFLRMVENG
jgi:pyridoxal 5'-phosphate synthase pdxT subunit